MRKILIFIIKIYQSTPLSCHDSCRFLPTCSNYSITAIEQYGCLKGITLTIKRILRCNPWGSVGYDPVPERRK